MKLSDIEPVIVELAKVRSKLNVLTSIDPELFHVKHEEYIDEALNLFHDIKEISLDMSRDVLACIHQLRYLSNTYVK